jgi:DNA-binding transcriptional LysR family regulator
LIFSFLLSFVWALGPVVFTAHHICGLALDRKSNDHIGSITAMNFAAFDLNLLRVFDALMRERSATRAGEQVGLSQPAVSAALNRLRDLLDDKLFVRQANDMVPTPRALSIAPGVRDALFSLEQLLAGGKVFDPKSLDRTFTLMGADFFGALLVPCLIEGFQQVSVRLSLRFVDTSFGDVQQLLNDDAIDAALEGPMDLPEWITSEGLFHSPFKIIVCQNNPALIGLENVREMPIELICSLQWALRGTEGSFKGPIDRALERLGKSRRVVLVVPHFHNLLGCIRNSNLAAAIPAQYADAFALSNGLRIFELPFKSPNPEIRLYWHSRRARDPAHMWLRQQIIEMCKPFNLLD